MSNRSKIRKSVIECYKIRPGGGVWADISLAVTNNGGRISINSNFGTWENFWGVFGENFKQFLCGCDLIQMAYVFGENRHFDHAATMEVLRKLVAEHDDEQEILEMIKEVEILDTCKAADVFNRVAYDSPVTKRTFDIGLCIQTTIGPGFRYFWDEIWPIFIEELKKEIAL